MTKETKELISLAAKAMGYEGHWRGLVYLKRILINGTHEEFVPFNPFDLSDRAAMCDQLEIDIYWLSDCEVVEAVKVKNGYKCFARRQEPYGTNKSHACSLACLRVAAEIGRRM